MKPICIGCKRFYRMQQSGFYFTEGMPRDNARPGTVDEGLWSPYKIWASDKWRCEGCGHELLSGFGQSAIAVQHQPDFAEQRKRLGADQFQVNDC